LRISQLSEPLETTSRTLDSTLENLDLVEKVVLEFAQRAGFIGTALEKVALAVREVVANAIIHGNRLDNRKKFVVTMVRTTNQLRIAVWDQGDGFDVDRLPDPRSPEVLLRESGRGTYLARAFMDEFHVRTEPAGGTTVSLIKAIRKSRTQRKQALGSSS